MKLHGRSNRSALFELSHLTPNIGTEVSGIDIGADLEDDVINYLSDLLVERVIFFRDQQSQCNNTLPLLRALGT